MNDSAEQRESRLRSLLKTITYRVLGTLTTTVLAYAVTGDVRVSLTIGGIEPVLKTVIYYLHERAWQRIPAGSLRR